MTEENKTKLWQICRHARLGSLFVIVDSENEKLSLRPFAGGELMVISSKGFVEDFICTDLIVVEKQSLVKLLTN